MRQWITSAFFGAMAFAGVASAQNPNQPLPNQPKVPQQQPQAQPQPTQQGQLQTQPQANQQPQMMQARVVRTEGNDRIVIRTSDNRDLTVFVSPQTKYLSNGQAARWNDVRAGSNLNLHYTQQGDRYLISQVIVGDAGNQPGTNNPQNANVFRGRISKINAEESIVVKSPEGKEVTFFTSKDARIQLNGQAGQFKDLQVGTEVAIQFVERDSHSWIQTLTVDATSAQQPNNGTEVHGSIIRIVGNDQVIVRTQDGKEVTVYVQPQTTYSIDNQPARLNDLQPGSQIRIQTETRDRRLFGRSILGLRRTNDR